MSGAAMGWAIDAMIASTLLMAVVLLVRGPVRRLFGPQVAYALWTLPLLRLVLPPLPAAWRAGVATPIGRAGETLVLIVRPDAAVPDVAAGSAVLASGLALVWAIGAAGFLLYHLVAHLGFCRRIVAAAVAVEEAEGVRVLTSAAAPGPVAFGLWRRTVAFPTDFAERYDAEERALALAHEIGHHQRGDLLANWAALGVLALHWFDPLAWRAFRAFRADQELANDARVLAGRSPWERHVYACAIVKAAHGGAVSAACHLHTIADLKGRLKMLATSPASRRRLASGAAAVAALAVAGLGLTASASGAAAISGEVRKAVRAAPAMPAMPTMPDMQTMPAAPAAPEPPALPEAAAAPTGEGHRISRVIVTRNGKTTVHDDYTSADIDAHLAAGDRVAIQPPVKGGSRMIVKMPDDPTSLVEVQSIPTVSSATCGIGTGTPASMVIDTGQGQKRRIVICTDRIRRVTADAMVTLDRTHNVERDAYARALTGLLDARTRAVADTGMSDADRSRALTAIDQSIVELRGQLARTN